MALNNTMILTPRMGGQDDKGFNTRPQRTGERQTRQVGYVGGFFLLTAALSTTKTENFIGFGMECAPYHQ